MMSDTRKVGGQWFVYSRVGVRGPFATESQANRAQGMQLREAGTAEAEGLQPGPAKQDAPQ